MRQLVDLVEQLLSLSQTYLLGQAATLLGLSCAYRAGSLLLFLYLAGLPLLLLRRYRKISLQFLRGKAVVVYPFLILLEGLQVERFEISSNGQVAGLILVEEIAVADDLADIAMHFLVVLVLPAF